MSYSHHLQSEIEYTRSRKKLHHLNVENINVMRIPGTSLVYALWLCIYTVINSNDFMSSSLWLAVGLRRIIYKILNVSPFDYTALAVSGKVGIPLNS